jgi:hypothetical protein
MKRIYLSGKISGLSMDEARANFARLAEYVRKVRGVDCIIINPLELNEGIDDWKTCMFNCLEALDECDEAFFMPNWYQSPGSNIEAYWCSAQNMKIKLVEIKDLKTMKV